MFFMINNYLYKKEKKPFIANVCLMILLLELQDLKFSNTLVKKQPFFIYLFFCLSLFRYIFDCTYLFVVRLIIQLQFFR